MKRCSLSLVLRIIAVAIWLVGAFVGYDIGDQMVTVGREVQYIFSFWSAALAWFVAFAAGMLFLGMARILSLLEDR